MARSASGRFTVKAKKSGHSGGKKHGKHGGRFGRGHGPGGHRRGLGGMLGKGLGLEQFTVGNIVLGGAGLVGSSIVSNYAAKFVPVEQLKSGVGKIAFKAAVSAAAFWIGKKVVPSRYLGPMALGAAAGIGADLVNEFVLPAMPGLHGLNDYSPIADQLAAIELENPGSLNGLLAIDRGSDIGQWQPTMADAAA